MQYAAVPERTHGKTQESHDLQHHLWDKSLADASLLRYASQAEVKQDGEQSTREQTRQHDHWPFPTTTPTITATRHETHKKTRPTHKIGSAHMLIENGSTRTETETRTSTSTLSQTSTCHTDINVTNRRKHAHMFIESERTETETEIRTSTSTPSTSTPPRPTPTNTSSMASKKSSPNVLSWFSCLAIWQDGLRRVLQESWRQGPGSCVAIIRNPTVMRQALLPLDANSESSSKSSQDRVPSESPAMASPCTPAFFPLRRC